MAGLSTFEFLKLRPSTPIRTELLPLVVTVLSILVGIYYRVGDQATKDLYVDEVWRATVALWTLEDRSVDLIARLSEIGLGWLGLSIFGKAEIGFRLFPCIASLLSLPLYAAVSWRILSPWMTAFTTFCFAVSYGFVEHAHEFKLYSIEIFFILLFFWWIVRSGGKLFTGTLVLFLSALAILLSNLFLLFLPLLALPLLTQPKNSYARLLPILSIPLLLFTFHWWLYLGTYLQSIKKLGVFSYWDQSYLSLQNLPFLLSFQVPDSLHWYVMSILPEPARFYLPWLVLFFLLAIFQPIRLIRQQNLLGIITLAPLVSMTVLSSINLYPFFSRASAFYYPLLLLMLGSICDEFVLTPLLNRYPRCSNYVGGGLLAVLALWLIQHPYNKHPSTSLNIWEVKRTFAEITDKIQKNDVILMNFFCWSESRFYDLPAHAFYPRIKLDESAIQKDFPTFLNKLEQRFPQKSFYFCGIFSDTFGDWLKAQMEENGYIIKNETRFKEGHVFSCLRPNS